MGATALVSGGKDSIFSAYLSECQGIEVDELLTLLPEDPDSMMYHTPNLPMVALQAEAWGKRHRSVPIQGRGEGADAEALFQALSGASDVVIAGAIQSSYQWSRLHRVAFELGRRVYAPLWGKDPARVVRSEIEAGLDIRLVHLAAEPLDRGLIGAQLDRPMLEELERRSRSHRSVNVAGEGGEFETLVVDAPFFRSRIVLDAVEVVEGPQTTRLVVRSARLETKTRKDHQEERLPTTTGTE